MSKNITFDIQAAKEFARRHKKDNGLKIELIDDAINSVGKRNDYLIYFYAEFLELTQEAYLASDRIGIFKDKGIVLRTKYEAISFAFISNLHEMLDSYPFIYLGIHSDENPTKKKLDWDTLTFDNQLLKDKVTELKGNHNFKLLKDLNNYRKHGALPKIKNLYSYLEINTHIDGDENYKNLKELMRDLHNKLVPQYFEILNLTFKEP